MKNSTSFSRTLLVHLLLWIIFLALPVFFAPTAGQMGSGRLPFHFYIPYLASSVLLVVIYYLNYGILTPKWFFKRQYLTYFAIISVLLITLLIVPEVDHLFKSYHGHHHPFQHRHGGRSDHFVPRNRLFHFSPFELQIFVMGIIVIILSTLMATVQRLRQSEQEKSMAELSFLKAQINPHFLFNTLNSIYSLAYRKSDQTASAIVKLSALMRHVITDAQKEEVSLTKEVEYISNYIELQKLRLTESTKVEFAVNGETEGKMVAPLIFLPFIENAFKYGSNPEHGSCISIRLDVRPNSLLFEVTNSIVNDASVSSERIGVGNAIDRLELIYPGQHLLKIRHEAQEYSVSLHIELK